VLEAGPLRFSPTEVLAPSDGTAQLDAMAMDTEDSLREYLSLQLRLPLLARLGPLARTLDWVATAAPGVREILTVGKVGWEVREDHYDLVVVDAPATGHVVGHLRAPQAINELLTMGLIREQTSWLGDLLADPSTTGVVVVTTAEEMPVAETLELVARLAEPDVEVDVAGVIVNRVLPELFGRGEEALFEAVADPARRPVLDEAVGADTGPVLDAARLAVSLRRSRAAHLARLREALPTDIPVSYVPELFSRVAGRRATLQVADLLGQEL
jgi:anion-transporting  ArsA/GET3 family ATPase